jgi:hypothetical protein
VWRDQHLACLHDRELVEQRQLNGIRAAPDRAKQPVDLGASRWRAGPPVAGAEFPDQAEDRTPATCKPSWWTKTVALTLQSNPTGLQLSESATTATAPFTVTAIVNAQIVLTAPTPQKLLGRSYVFLSWSDGGARSHTITVPPTNTTYTARYRRPTYRAGVYRRR